MIQQTKPERPTKTRCTRTHPRATNGQINHPCWKRKTKIQTIPNKRHQTEKNKQKKHMLFQELTSSNHRKYWCMLWLSFLASGTFSMNINDIHRTKNLKRYTLIDIRPSMHSWLLHDFGTTSERRFQIQESVNKFLEGHCAITVIQNVKQCPAFLGVQKQKRPIDPKWKNFKGKELL